MKTTCRSHLPLMRVAIIKQTHAVRIWGRGWFRLCWCKHRLAPLLRKLVWRIIIEIQNRATVCPTIALLVLSAKESPSTHHRGVYTAMLIATCFIIPKIRSQTRCPQQEMYKKYGMQRPWGFIYPLKKEIMSLWEINLTSY